MFENARGYTPLIDRTYRCVTCGQSPGPRTHVSEGDDCPKWNCEGGPVLSEQNQRAVEQLMNGGSETCIRLARYARREEWQLSTESFLQPLIATEGEIVLRVSSESGTWWVWWAGSPLGDDFFKCMSTLPHFHDHKIIGRRSGSPSRLRSLFEENHPTPVHVLDTPETIREAMSSDISYRESEPLAAP